MAITTVGIIGGGQLAQMMAAVAPSLQLQVVVQTPHPTDPAASWAHDVILASIDDAHATAQLADQCQVITFENEFIDIAALYPLASRIRFCPSLEALAPLLDKYHQRRYLEQIGLPVPTFIALPQEPGPHNWPQEAFPAVLKTRRQGYDGQGTVVVHSEAHLQRIWSQRQPQDLLLESWVPFQKELAIVGARSVQGEIALFPVVETQQVNYVCRRVFVPAPISPSLQNQIQAMMTTLLTTLEVVGVFALELFLLADNRILVNEIAPRTHNSGHYTIDACHTSQFEQQLRAVSQQPLQDPSLICEGAIMVNLLGLDEAEPNYEAKRAQLQQLPDTYVHWYEKTSPRPGRKLGHATTLVTRSSSLSNLPSLSNLSPSSDLIEILQARASHLEQIWYGEHLN